MARMLLLGSLFTVATLASETSPTIALLGEFSVATVPRAAAASPKQYEDDVLDVLNPKTNVT